MRRESGEGRRGKMREKEKKGDVEMIGGEDSIVRMRDVTRDGMTDTVIHIEIEGIHIADGMIETIAGETETIDQTEIDARLVKMKTKRRKINNRKKSMMQT